MGRSPAMMKFLVACSIPALYVLLAIVGGDRWGGYSLFAGLLAIVGAICMAQVVHTRSTRIVAGIVYLVVVGLLLVILP